MQTHPHPGAGLYTAHAGGTSRISFAHDRDPRLVFTSRDDARQALALARDWSSETGRPVSVGLPYMKELLHVDGVMDHETSLAVMEELIGLPTDPALGFSEAFG
jgi:hypothetical protein